MNCAGCDRPLVGGPDTFGDGAEVFCFCCWHEELDLRSHRKPLLSEKRSLERGIEDYEDAIRVARADPDPEDINEIPLLEMAIDSLREHLSDVEDELRCLSVRYQLAAAL